MIVDLIMVLIALINSTQYQAQIKIDIFFRGRKLNVEEIGVHKATISRSLKKCN
jgi:hypothetical protein